MRSLSETAQLRAPGQLEEAAAASGLAAVSAPYLPAASNSPQPPADGPWSGAHPSAPGAAAGAATVTMRSRGWGVWRAVGAVVVVLAMPACPPAGGGPRSTSGVIVAGRADAGVAATAPADAAPADAAPADAEMTAASGPDTVTLHAFGRGEAAGKLDEHGEERTAEPTVGGSQVEIAARLNQEGMELITKGRFGEAARKFQEAIAHVPRARYFINLCVARFEDGELDLALIACNAVALNNPTADEQVSADRMIKRIRERARPPHGRQGARGQ